MKIFNFNSDNIDLDTIITGFNFREYQNMLIFDKYTRENKCDSKYTCVCDKRKVRLDRTNSKCGNYDVMLLFPVANVSVVCHPKKDKKSDANLVAKFKKLEQ